MELTEGTREFILLTCHSGELASAEGLLRSTIVVRAELRHLGKLEAHDMYLHTSAGGRLHAGGAVRWNATSNSNVAKPAATDDQRSARRER